MKFEIYTDAKEQHRWRLRADNGRIVADCGGGYANRADCLHGIELLKNDASSASVEEARASSTA